MLKLPAIQIGLGLILFGLASCDCWLVVPGLVVLALGLFYFRWDFPANGSPPGG